jgi:hypothetical protein
MSNRGLGQQFQSAIFSQRNILSQREEILAHQNSDVNLNPFNGMDQNAFRSQLGTYLPVLNSQILGNNTENQVTEQLNNNSIQNEELVS